MRRRILLVTRRFWPLGAAEESWLLEMATSWRESGADVTVVTPQWDRTWPTRLVVREMDVVRLPYAPKRLWGGYWYLRRLNHWLRRTASQFDLIVVWRLQFDALLATRVGQDLKIPVALLYEGAGAEGDAAWLKQSRYGERILAACQHASAVLTLDEASQAEALRLALNPETCHLVNSGSPLRRNEVSRQAARIHLLESNRDFFTTPATPVGLTISTLEDREAMGQLFAAWSRLRRSHHDSRLWWIGDGPKRTSLYAMLGDYDLRYHAVLPGDFDDFEDLFAAADFYIAGAPNAAKLARPALMRGLPVFAADSAEVRGLIPQTAPVRFFPARDAEGLSRLLRQACDAPEETARWRRETGNWAASQGSFAQLAQHFLEIFASIGAAPR